MRSWERAAWTAAIVAAAGIGAALAPAVEGQTAAPRRETARVVQFGGGSWIGVSVRDVEADDVAKTKLPAPGGVLVEEVSRESPAETAGLKNGDVIVEFDGERVRSTRQFTRLVQETPAGRKVQASVMRDGQRVPITVEPREGGGARFFSGLDRLPEIAGAWAVPPEPPAPPAAPGKPAPPAPPAPAMPFRYFDFDDLLNRSGGGGRLGVTITELQPQLADYFGAKEGVLVTSVRTDSVASRAGLKAGDVITSLNGSTVRTGAELRERTAGLKDGEEFSISVLRDKKATTLKGKAEAPSTRRRSTAVVL
jgi:serine protease Do